MKGLRILAPFLKRYRWHFMFGVLFVFATNALAVWVPILIGQAVNFVENRQIDRDELLLFASFIITVAALAACFRFLMRRVLIDASRNIEYEFRNAFFRKLQSLDPTFFDDNNTGDLMSRATNDTDAVRLLIGPGIMYSANTIFGFPLKLGGMLLLDWKLTLLAVLPMGLLPPMVKYFGHKTYVLSRQQQDSFGFLTTTVQENLAGMRVVKAYRQEEPQRQKFLERNNDYINKSLDLARVQSFFFPSLRVLISFGMAILLAVGGYRVMEGYMRIGTLFSFLLLFAEIVWPLIAAGWTINVIQRGLASLERIGKVMHAEPQVQESGEEDTPEGFEPKVEFRSLTFQYDGTDRPQLSQIDLTIPPGKTLGIVGPVGSGKSTLVHLLARLYPVERGMIFFGGKDINDWPTEEVRRRIAFVFQESFLFSDTIGWNIRFGADDNTPQDRVESVAHQASVHEDILETPHRYDTILGERGVNLSGGQKQRLALARALLRSADVLILDDTLSAVDTHTEEAILGELRSMMHGKTTFLISHRISTVAMSDEIIVLEDGAITQRGRHEELIVQPGLYADLHRKQLSEQAVEEFEEDEFEGAPQ